MQSSSPPRREIRRARRALPPQSQRLHAEAVAKRLGRRFEFLHARRIAFYWPADGELDPRPLMARALALGKECHLPVLSTSPVRASQPPLRFARYRPQARLRPNRYGIPEPVAAGSQLLTARHLDLLILPLVAFDATCNRIGMGGGYYDRSLAFLRFRNRWRRPRLIGVAHECQRLEQIEPAPWDVRLDAVATESRLYGTREPRGIGPTGSLL
ncbi:5-formyltetrahydrofolate cyclo-ligase [Imhoffiella purpurea]|uniref:5-formyltetrahydrofolate cyclo-ligase n=1 Tax=Imhoffiella purpurea TaxID=1249627 RepID=W9VAE6_9GAMM|nr:5-formyltetrahydrofolate cyclo-ligase [Imhoffiella purpurea]EXJ16404.1 5-formyltetrahydrofolate cyclo-ligase [Imhoffiella purpurea]